MASLDKESAWLRLPRKNKNDGSYQPAPEDIDLVATALEIYKSGRLAPVQELNLHGITDSCAFAEINQIEQICADLELGEE